MDAYIQARALLTVTTDLEMSKHKRNTVDIMEWMGLCENLQSTDLNMVWCTVFTKGV